MRNLLLLFLIFSFALCVFPQKTKLSAGQKGNEKSDLEKALKTTPAYEKIAALQKFIAKYPKSKELINVRESIVSARAEFADNKLESGDYAGGIELFKTAILEAPTPISDRLFTVILTFPSNLFLRGQVIPAYDVADLVQAKTENNPERMLALATFYIQVENGVYAKKLAEQAIELDPNSAKAYQTLGLANRLIFFLQEAADAYSKAAELEGEKEFSAKRNFADLKRGLGKPEEAILLYREILAVYSDDITSQTGLTLALFDAGKQAEAEAEMEKTLLADSNNMPLLVGAAYWYAANNQPDKAIPLAKEAIVIEPRYVWSYIALSRALMLKKNPLEAEKVLLSARQFGNFPTLSYEIAAVRLQAGFFRDAADELNQNFVIKDGVIQTKLGGRVIAESDNFIELLQLERQSSIFQRIAADSPENAGRLKSLLEFSNIVSTDSADEAKILEVTDSFINGDDKMKFHRQIFAATRLLEANKHIPKVKEIVKAALPLLESSLNVANPAAAVLADQLYEARNYAIRQGEMVIVPDVPKETLQTVLRGRLEEISGWAEQQESNPERAVVHYKRGLSILPKESAMWHSTMWRLGTALQAQGKNKEALEAYIQSYQGTTPAAGRYFVIESLYKQVNGSTDGLEKKIGTRPVDEVAAIANAPIVKETTSETENPDNKSENTENEKLPLDAEVDNKPETETVENNESDTVVPTVVVPEVQTEHPSENEKPEIQNEKQSETQPVIEDETPETEKPVVKTETTPRSTLFEPIVIGIPKTQTKTVEKPETEIKSDAPSRPRVVIENTLGNSTNTACQIVVTQDSVSLLNNGGNIGLLVALDNAPDDAKVTSVSSSPDDVQAELEPNAGSYSSRSFYIIRSVSKNKGVYTVTFQSECGNKEVTVRVR